MRAICAKCEFVIKNNTESKWWKCGAHIWKGKKTVNYISGEVMITEDTPYFCTTVNDRGQCQKFKPKE